MTTKGEGVEQEEEKKLALIDKRHRLMDEELLLRIEVLEEQLERFAVDREWHAGLPQRALEEQRRFFASSAMNGLIVAWHDPTPDDVAEEAVRFADAMMRALKK